MWVFPYRSSPPRLWLVRRPILRALYCGGAEKGAREREELGSGGEGGAEELGSGGAGGRYWKGRGREELGSGASSSGANGSSGNSSEANGSSGNFSEGSTAAGANRTSGIFSSSGGSESPSPHVASGGESQGESSSSASASAHPLALCGDFDAYLQMDMEEVKTETGCAFPQIEHMQELAQLYPNAIWLFPTRPAKKWANSVFRWGNLARRFKQCAFKGVEERTRDSSIGADVLFSGEATFFRGEGTTSRGSSILGAEEQVRKPGEERRKPGEEVEAAASPARPLSSAWQTPNRTRVRRNRHSSMSASELHRWYKWQKERVENFVLEGRRRGRHGLVLVEIAIEKADVGPEVDHIFGEWLLEYYRRRGGSGGAKEEPVGDSSGKKLKTACWTHANKGKKR